VWGSFFIQSLLGPLNNCVLGLVSITNTVKYGPLRLKSLPHRSSRLDLARNFAPYRGRSWPVCVSCVSRLPSCHRNRRHNLRYKIWPGRCAEFNGWGPARYKDDPKDINRSKSGIILISSLSGTLKHRWAHLNPREPNADRDRTIISVTA